MKRDKPVDFTPNPIDREAMLVVLRQIYAKTSAHPARVSISRILAECGHPAIANKRNQILAAMRMEGVILKVSGSTKSAVWMWNLEAVGPPSLSLVNALIYAMTRYSTNIRRDYDRRRRARRVAEASEDGSRT